MMRKIITITLIILLLDKLGFSQNLKLYIDSVEVSNIVYNIEQIEYIEEGKMNGPSIMFYCRFKNIDTTHCAMHPSKAIFHYSFFLENKLYSDYFYPLSFGNISTLILKPDEDVLFAFYILVFLGTPIHNINFSKFDYTIEIMKILPTLVIYYNELDRFMIESERIKKVKVLY
jgi:hypothetical protein